MRLFRLLAVLAALASGMVTMSSASAQVGPPVLTGERFLSPDASGGGAPPQVTANCNPFGTSTISFTVTGIAVGPYPGTFTESGTAVIDTTNPFVFGPVTSFNASFTIDSPIGTVSGTKSLINNPIRAGDLGFCSEGALVSFVVATDYQAQIDSGGATYADQGETNAALNEPPGGLAGGAFEEDFYSNLLDVIPLCTPDAQGDQNQDGDAQGC